MHGERNKSHIRTTRLAAIANKDGWCVRENVVLLNLTRLPTGRDVGASAADRPFARLHLPLEPATARIHTTRGSAASNSVLAIWRRWPLL